MDKEDIIENGINKLNQKLQKNDEKDPLNKKMDEKIDEDIADVANPHPNPTQPGNLLGHVMNDMFSINEHNQSDGINHEAGDKRIVTSTIKRDVLSSNPIDYDVANRWCTLHPKDLKRWHHGNDKVMSQFASNYIYGATDEYIIRMKTSKHRDKVYDDAEKYLPDKNMTKVINHANLKAPDVPKLSRLRQGDVNSHMQNYFGSSQVIEEKLLSPSKIDHAYAYTAMNYYPKTRKALAQSNDKLLRSAVKKYDTQHQGIDYDFKSSDDHRAIRADKHMEKLLNKDGQKMNRSASHRKNNQHQGPKPHHDGPDMN